MSLSPKERNGRFRYSIFAHPVARVLKFRRWSSRFDQIESGRLALDYGSGDRPYERLVLRRFERYLSADHPEANQAHAASFDLPIIDGRVDLADAEVDFVLMTEVLEHVYEPKAVLGEVARLLRPGGTLLGSVPFAMGEHERPHDYHRYTCFCLDRMLSDAGFEVVAIEYVGDMFGVAVSAWSKIANVVPKMARKLHLGWLGDFVHTLLRAPELLYYLCIRIGLDPGRIAYFRHYPLGFVFEARRR